MKQNLIVNSTNNGKNYQKTYGYLNPEATDTAVEGFATMTTALTTNQYTGADIVTKRSVNEPVVTPAPAVIEYNDAALQHVLDGNQN